MTTIRSVETTRWQDMLVAKLSTMVMPAAWEQSAHGDCGSSSADADIIVRVSVLRAARNRRANVQATAATHKSLKYRRISDTSVRFETGRRASWDHGTRTAKGAFAMMNVSNILLLDEEDLMREATALLLANRGTNVTKTATLDEAITQLERRTYDVVIVDIHENAADPSVWLQSILAKTTSPARVIVCTEKPLPNIKAEGISHVLVKPYPFDQLVEAVFASRSTPLRYTRPAVKSVARRSGTPRRTPLLMRRGRA